MAGHARVALVTAYYHPVLGGAETAARRLAGCLAGRGHEVLVITSCPDAALPRHETVDGAVIERIGPPKPRRGARKWTILPRLFAALWRHRRAYDVIAVVDYRGVGVAAIAAGRLLHRPVAIQAQTEGVMSCSNLDSALEKWRLSSRSLPIRLMTWPLRRLYRSADAVVCIASAIRREAVDAGVPAARLHDLPNTVDTARFRPTDAAERERVRAAHGWPRDKTIALFVGRLSREKGIADLLDAWARVPDAAVLVVVGPDMPGHPWDEGPRVRQQSAALGGRVIVFGASDDTAELYRGADLAIVPSHWESFGISAVEAMASGLPVIASAVGGLTDYIVDGENGLLVPAHDPAALAAAIVRVVQDPRLRARLGAAARVSVARFDEHLVLDQFGTLLDRLAGQA
jgi:D-inositol-3-phosphate glycosyltransferase